MLIILLLIEKHGEMFTNIKSNDYQEVIDNMESQKIYWNIDNGKIVTNLIYINQDNIKYKYNFKTIQNSVYELKEDEDQKLKGYNIYSCYNEEKSSQVTNFLMSKNFYTFMLANRNLPIYVLITSCILLIIIAVYLFWAIGHKEGEDGINLNSIDRFPYEILSIICCSIIIIFPTIGINIMNIINTNYYITLIILIILYFICYVACGVWGVTTIKRLKAKKFLKSFLIYKIIKWFYNNIKSIIDNLGEKTESTKKVFWIYLGFIFVNMILILTIETGISFILLIIFWVWSFLKIRRYMKWQDEIKQALNDIYDGKTDIHLDEKELKGILKEMAIYVNDIAGGFSNAIEQNLKSERLKTELITNVSHDIKTPLTSIINYVDLLKKEDIKDEKIKEYVDILDMKSQRLKKLMEDLIDASKASSGNVKLNMEEINLKELFNQSIGEFKDKFEEKKLMIETTMPSEDVIINADNRYMYRVIENLFSNITKYALDNSRIYIDIKQEKYNIEISIKNISKDKLNISSDELMQRFVRGDKSRYTEGSGLRIINS